MNSILTSIREHESLVILFLLVAVLAIAVLAIRAIRESTRVNHRFRDLLEGSRGENLETLLHKHLAERMQLQAEIERLSERTNELELKMRRTKRFLGMVRYDAFEDVGGEQSFAVALFDDNGDGAVLTSIVGRTDCRVYGKSLSNGKAERSLSKEEQAAIDAASEQPKAQSGVK